MELRGEKYSAFFNEIKKNSVQNSNGYKKIEARRWYEGDAKIKNLKTGEEYKFNFKTNEIYKVNLEQKILNFDNVKFSKKKLPRIIDSVLENLIEKVKKNQNGHTPEIYIKGEKITRKDLEERGFIPDKNGQLHINYKP